MHIVTILCLLASCAAAPATSGTKTVHFTVDTGRDVHEISPYIYGTNIGAPRATCNRVGGNRWTAYNWETNASNAGSDWHHQNDDFLSKSHEPGAPVRDAIEAAAKDHQALIIPVPTAGYVSADANADGDVNRPPTTCTSVSSSRGRRRTGRSRSSQTPSIELSTRMSS